MNFARRATDFLNQYFSSLVDFMMNDKNYFSQVILLKPCLCFEVHDLQFLVLRLLKTAHVNFIAWAIEEARPFRSKIQVQDICSTFATLEG